MNKQKAMVTCPGCRQLTEVEIAGTPHAKDSPAGQRHMQRELSRGAFVLGWRGFPAKCPQCVVKHIESGAMYDMRLNLQCAECGTQKSIPVPDAPHRADSPEGIDHLQSEGVRIAAGLGWTLVPRVLCAVHAPKTQQGAAS
jgi:ribosomal protein L44E